MAIKIHYIIVTLSGSIGDPTEPMIATGMNERSCCEDFFQSIVRAGYLGVQGAVIDSMATYPIYTFDRLQKFMDAHNGFNNPQMDNTAGRWTFTFGTTRLGGT